MMFADEKTLKALREKFSVGCRVVLDAMDDPQAPAIGTQGTCTGVDDAGSVLVAWDNGSGLNVAYGADSCHCVASEEEIKVSLDHLGKTRHRGAFCPRCGTKVDEEYSHQLQALSRRADILICNRCGTEEALEDIAWGGHQNMKLFYIELHNRGQLRLSIFIARKGRKGQDYAECDRQN